MSKIDLDDTRILVTCHSKEEKEYIEKKIIEALTDFRDRQILYEKGDSNDD